MKKSAIIIILMIIFCLINTVSYGLECTDIENHWCKSEIIRLCEKDLFKLEGDFFRPDEMLTKADFCFAINRIFNYDEDFMQVDDWQEKEFEIGIEKGYMPIGSSDDLLSREEACVILDRIYGNEFITKTNNQIEDFKDYIDVSTWAKESVNSLIQTSIVIGYPDKTIRMKQKITRAEFAIILYRYQNNWQYYEMQDERLDLKIGSIIENEEGNLIFEEIDNELTLMTNDIFTLAIQMPSGYEATEELITIGGSKGVLELDEFTYEITAKKPGKATIEVCTYDKKYRKKIIIKVM